MHNLEKYLHRLAPQHLVMLLQWKRMNKNIFSRRFQILYLQFEIALGRLKMTITRPSKQYGTFRNHRNAGYWLEDEGENEKSRTDKKWIWGQCPPMGVPWCPMPIFPFHLSLFSLPPTSTARFETAETLDIACREEKGRKQEEQNGTNGQKSGFEGVKSQMTVPPSCYGKWFYHNKINTGN